MKIYETSSMTGPLTEPGKLFARLRVEDDFRQVPVASELAAQRTEPLDRTGGKQTRFGFAQPLSTSHCILSNQILNAMAWAAIACCSRCIRRHTSLDV